MLRRHPRSTASPCFKNDEAYRQMAAEGNDLNVNFGDTISADSTFAARADRDREDRLRPSRGGEGGAV